MSLTITATIASQAQKTNEVSLSAMDSERPHDAPVWEFDLVAPQADPSIWNLEKAEQVLQNHGYRRVGSWWSSTTETGYPSWSAKVEKASITA